MSIELINGDCLDEMAKIPDNSIDAIITDPPYGTTYCSWDSTIPLDLMWTQLKRIIKPNGAIVLFGSQPFTSKLISSNYEMFKYCWVWEKGRSTGFLHAKNKPMKKHEDISVFSDGVTVHKSQSTSRMTYNPQVSMGTPYNRRHRTANMGSTIHTPSKSNLDYVGGVKVNTGERLPTSILKYSMHNVGNLHPTQKPVELMEYLIKTYTEENEMVLDFTMGSGSTGHACLNCNRNFIGIELDKDYFEKAKDRLTNHVKSDSKKQNGLLKYS